MFYTVLNYMILFGIFRRQFWLFIIINIASLSSVMSLKCQLAWVPSRRSTAVLSVELPFSRRDIKIKLLSSYGRKKNLNIVLKPILFSIVLSNISSFWWLNYFLKQNCHKIILESAFQCNILPDFILWEEGFIILYWLTGLFLVTLTYISS